MDINQLFSIIEDKQSYNEDTISEVKKLLGSYPYFQTGHALLLKAMRVAKPEKFNEQLNISGSFISDKVKLFKFINLDNSSLKEAQNDDVKKTEPETKVVAESKKETKNIKDKVIPTKLKEDQKPIESVLPTQKEKIVKDLKADVKKVSTEDNKGELTEKKVEFEVKAIKKEPQVKIQKIDKVEKLEKVIKIEKGISEEEQNKKIIKKSKERHKRIVKDFFIDPTKNVEVIDETTNSDNLQRKKEGKKEGKKEEELDKVPFNEKIRRLDEDKKNAKKEEQISSEKEIESKKTPFDKKNTIKEKPVNVKGLGKLKETETKKDEKKKVERKVLDKKIVKNEAPVEKKKLLSLDNVVSTNGLPKKEHKKQSDVMNDIFSKIRAIKKEMNISTDENKETIDVNSNVRKRKPSKFQESSDVKKEEKNEIEKDIVENKQIEKKEDVSAKSEKANVVKNDDIPTDDKLLTAKDLFKLHKKKKTDNNETPVENKKSRIESLFENNVDTKKDNITEKTEVVVEKKLELVDELIKKDKPELVNQNIEVENINKKDELISVDDKLIEKEEDVKETVNENNTELLDEEKVDLKEKKEELRPVVNKLQDNDEKENVVKKESAAEALLRRIAQKKQRMKQADDNEVEKELSEKETINKVENEKGDNLKNVSEPKIIENSEEIVEEIQKPIVEKKVIKKPKKSKSLIDDFISKSDSLERLDVEKDTELKGNIAEKSFEEKDEFMTEAMADLFMEQKYYDKALGVYNKLILKFPQKKTYFAIQIKKVESLIKNNKK